MNNVAYISSELSFWTLDFSLFQMMQVPLCHYSMVAGAYNENDCPGDGLYKFSTYYRLPATGRNGADWLSTGWEGSGFVRMYAEENESMLIGECLLTLQTLVTPDDSQESFIRTPTAAVTAGMILGVGAVVALSCMYCYCCLRNNQTEAVALKHVSPAKSPEAEMESAFKRFEDEKESAGHGRKSPRVSWTSRRAQSSNYTAPAAVGSLPLM